MTLACDIRKKRENMRGKWERLRGRDLDICKRAKITLGFSIEIIDIYHYRYIYYFCGFFSRRRGLQVDNNSKFARQFLQVTFEMLKSVSPNLSIS